MKLSRIMVICFVVVFALGIMPGILKAEEFRIAIVQDDKASVQAYEPLVAHLAKNGNRGNPGQGPDVSGGCQDVFVG